MNLTFFFISSLDSESENKKGSCKQQLFGTLANTQNNMDELMGLCSGKFAEGSAKSKEQLFETQADTQNMEELMGLCSGKFDKRSVDFRASSHSITNF